MPHEYIQCRLRNGCMTLYPKLILLLPLRPRSADNICFHEFLFFELHQMYYQINSGTSALETFLLQDYTQKILFNLFSYNKRILEYSTQRIPVQPRESSCLGMFSQHSWMFGGNWYRSMEEEGKILNLGFVEYIYRFVSNFLQKK